jgi:hypothetical protein
LMPLSAVVTEYYNSSILMAFYHNRVVLKGLFILWFVERVIRHSDVIILLKLVLI